jgi:hypothetical protein
MEANGVCFPDNCDGRSTGWCVEKATATAISDRGGRLHSAAFITATGILVGVTRPTNYNDNLLQAWSVHEDGLSSLQRVKWCLKDRSGKVELKVATDGWSLLVSMRSSQSHREENVKQEVWWADPATLLPTTQLDTTPISPQSELWSIACKGDLAVVAPYCCDSVYLFNEASLLRKVELPKRPDITPHIRLLDDDLLLVGSCRDGHAVTAWRLSDKSPTPLWEAPSDFGQFVLLPNSRRIVTLHASTNHLASNEAVNVTVSEVGATGAVTILARRLPVTGMQFPSRGPMLCCGFISDPDTDSLMMLMTENTGNGREGTYITFLVVLD